MKVTYRQFNPYDRDTVGELIKALFREDPGGLTIDDEKIDKTFAHLITYPNHGTILVMEKGNEIIGYSILINFWSNQHGGNALYIDEIYIKPSFRRQGIGTDFIKYLINTKFNNAKLIMLEVTPENKKAKQLYEDIGFILCDNNHLIYNLAP